MKIAKYLALPREMTPFEQRYLERLNKIALVFFYLHIPVFMAVAWVAGTGPLKALLLGLFVMAGPTLAYRTVKHPRTLSVIYGITAMLMGGLLVHFGQGPVQIEMHFYFFALLAMLCMFANPLVNIAAAVTVALHHLLVWLIVPGSVFNYDAQWWVVLVHAAFVILETIAACYISREFFDNVIGLERIVQARTQVISEKQRDMRLILDNVETGLVTIDMQGRMSAECSRVLAGWFGAPATGARLSGWLGARDPNFGEWLELGLDGVSDGMLPPEVAMAQLPRTMKDGPRTLAVAYRLITGSDDTAEKILVILTDITERLRSEAAERHQADLLQLFQHIMLDKFGFIEFLAEAEEIVRTVKAGKFDSPSQLQRLVHTLKGNSAIFGLRRLSEICHQVESRIAEERDAPGAVEMSSLFEAWAQIRTDLEKLMGERRPDFIEIDDRDYEAIIHAVLDGVDSKVVVRMIESWQLEPAGKRLARIEHQIKALAARMGKGDVRVAIEPHGVRFSNERFAPFWAAFIHVLRNAVDHGIEDAELRRRKGKPRHALIKVATTVESDRFIVSVEDDGPGVDWDALRVKANELGIAPSLLEKRENLVFLPGVSSKRVVTELSGRGVGLVAVRDACEALGGKVELTSEPGTGTRVRFVFPKDQTIYEGHAEVLRQAATAAAAG
jgi:HPt (histidine-containing phosphotransfer) domain-containing protein